MRYHLLKSEGDVQSYSSEDALTDVGQRRKIRSWFPLLMSCLLNLALLYWILNAKTGNSPGRSDYASLLEELSIPWVQRTEYGTNNITHGSELWEAIEFDSGIVALDQDWTKEKGLPDSQPFPWDTTKGLYVLNGYHSMHCLKSIHLSITEWNLGKPQTYPLAHITHCLDNLRLEVMCQADDTPRWTSSDDKPENGIGQHRMCRDWSKLTSWAQEHPACYRRLVHGNDIDQMERFKFCPPGSPYLTKVRKYFGLADEWVP